MNRLLIRTVMCLMVACAAALQGCSMGERKSGYPAEYNWHTLDPADREVTLPPGQGYRETSRQGVGSVDYNNSSRDGTGFMDVTPRADH